MYTINTHTTKADKQFLSHIFDNIEGTKGMYFDDLHHHLFNEDYFIIGYYQAEQFIKENDLNVFELIQFCQEQEKENFGEIQNTFDNAEKLVNHYAYWRGQELLNSLECLGSWNSGTMVISDRLIKHIQQEIKESDYNI